jgi:hypothetical protein
MPSTTTRDTENFIRPKLTYFVDIDSTIFHTFGNDYENARPIPSRIARINALFDEGHTVVYWTARGGNSGIDWHDFTVKQLYKAGAKYSRFLHKKPSYDVWIDDKAIHSDDFFK